LLFPKRLRNSAISFAYNKNAEKIADLLAPKPHILLNTALDKISSEIIFITTPDSEIRSVAESLAEKLTGKALVFHASGALSSTVLESLQQRGHETASLHPLASISDPISGATRFKNAFFLRRRKW
jgi:predicted short-subunit dehydrogenase-like oxidoreductase (DUF2520 family)